MTRTIEIDFGDDGIAVLRLNRPEKHNAISALMIEELHQAAEDLGAQAAVRVVVLAANGPSFCAGGDLAWMQDQLTSDNASRAAEAKRLALMLQALNTMPKPLIGAVEGNAFGGGVGLMCVCDLVVASEEARFGLTETRLGLVPATIGPYVIARMSEGKARRVFMSSRRFDAHEALALDIVAQIVPQDRVLTTALSHAQPYLACAPKAVAAAKALARSMGAPITDAHIDASIAALIECWQGDEAREGIAAFFAKRKAKWNTQI